jgi:hypothetical protein
MLLKFVLFVFLSICVVTGVVVGKELSKSYFLTTCHISSEQVFVLCNCSDKVLRAFQGRAGGFMWIALRLSLLCTTF